MEWLLWVFALVQISIIVISAAHSLKSYKGQVKKLPGFGDSLVSAKEEIEKLGEVGKVVFAKCIKACSPEHNSYLYKGRAFGSNDSQASMEFKCKRRGRHFETRVNARFNKGIDGKVITIKRQWKIGGGACDFVFFWNDKDNKQRAVLFECKHSDSYNQNVLQEHVNKGLLQIKRYKELAYEKHQQEFDLLILLIDFPVSWSSSAIGVKSKVVILNYSLIEEFLEGLNEWCDITRRQEEEIRP